MMNRSVSVLWDMAKCLPRCDLEIHSLPFWPEFTRARWIIGGHFGILPCHAKVYEFDAALFGQQNIARFDVAVGDPTSVRVKKGKGREDLDHNGLGKHCELGSILTRMRGLPMIKAVRGEPGAG
jgi:hypothetical protein